MYKLPKDMFVLSRAQGEYTSFYNLFVVANTAGLLWVQIPTWLVVIHAIGTALVQSWTPTVRTWMQGVGIKREEKPKGGRKIHLQLECKEKNLKTVKLDLD